MVFFLQIIQLNRESINIYLYTIPDIFFNSNFYFECIKEYIKKYIKKCIIYDFVKLNL